MKKLLVLILVDSKLYLKQAVAPKQLLYGNIMDPLNSEQRRRNMQANKATGTSTETLLAKALWLKGYRYRKNDKTVLGKPDIKLKSLKLSYSLPLNFDMVKV